MEKITLEAAIHVTPIPDVIQDENVITELKQLVFTDPDTGKIIYYKMSRELQELTARKLKMKNVALHNFLVEEQGRAEARARLGPNGGAATPQEQKIADDILRGVHTREKDEPD